MLDPSLTRQHFSTKIYRCYFHVLEHEYPEVDVRQLCEDSGLPYEYLTDENNWVSVTFDERFTRLCIERTGDANLCFRVGELAATHVGLGRIVYLTLKFGVTLDLLYTLTPRLARFVSRVTSFELVYVMPGSVAIRITARNLEHMNEEERRALRANFENIFQNTAGHLKSLPTLHGLPAAVLHQSAPTVSRETGFPVYLIRISYEPSTSPLALIRSYAAHLMGVGGTALSVLLVRISCSLTPFETTLLSASLLGLALAVLSVRKLKTITRSLEGMANDYELLDKRYEALQLAKEELQLASEVNSRYRRIVDEMKLGLMVLSRSSTGERWVPSSLSNPAFQRLARLTSGGEVSDLARRLMAAHLTDTSPMGERFAFERDGQPTAWVSIRRFPVDAQTIALIVEDITEQVSAEQALELERLRSAQSAKFAALGEMAAGISHELNNPLAIISGFSQQICELCEAEPLDRDRVGHAAQRVALTITRMVKIINGIRAFSRDASRDPMQVRGLSEILASTLELCEKRLRHHGVQLTVRGISDDMQVLCRDVEISQVLLNLLNNALDAVSGSRVKEVLIEGQETEDFYRLIIEDSGAGILPEHRSKVFHPFFTTKEIGKGTGLGLSIVKGIMENHGGAIVLDETATRTRFILSFRKAHVVSLNAA